jgi:hypothetical protein
MESEQLTSYNGNGAIASSRPHCSWFFTSEANNYFYSCRPQCVSLVSEPVTFFLHPPFLR